MRELIDLYRHNTWANERVLAVTVTVDGALLDAEASGTRGTIRSTLVHLARAEVLYLTLIQGQSRDSVESMDAFEARGLEWLRRHVHEVGERFVRVIDTATPDLLARRLDIAVQAPVTARDGLLQVLTHSSQHRSQVLTSLSTHGIATPDLDYVLMLNEQQGATG